MTEDEEIVTSSIKIASYFDNGDGIFTVYPDLREADNNPLADSDLLIGYYHNPGNTGIIYSVQQFTAISDPGSDQSILLEAEGDSIPMQNVNHSSVSHQEQIVNTSMTVSTVGRLIPIRNM